MAWWARVPHPQNLKNMAFDICREFDLQCPSEKDGQSHVSGSAKAANPTLVVDNEPNTVATKAYEVPPSHEPCLCNSTFDTRRHISYVQLQGKTFEDQTNLPSTQSLPNTSVPHSTGLIPRPDQPLRSVMSFQKPELLGFLDSPYNVWETRALAKFLPETCSGMRMVMPWTGTPLPTIELRFEVSMEFSEAFMKFRQSRLNDENTVQRAVHRIDSSGLGSAQ
ncbi:uncharacterized protein ATNIH1004_011576 [Aspergillus tanneri]|uniref:Uncharacterized protein n=1 Tax=Aspergillus tanneri TaxID=1220188 RepID=A0A5M9M797_9EURO|nr:uncharacterized protein ATNIH1004_011576 [Aspergillus tanneri]KAA8642631.1 hypothetical protein ATNIH1004_011576 [Aspergillus tanneri]